MPQASENGPPPGSGGHRLTLFVQEAKPRVYRFILDATDRTSGPNNEAYGPLRLHRDPRTYINSFFAELADLPGSAPEVAQRRLEGRGTKLFRQLFPLDLRRRLWALRHGTRTLQVQSDEPWIPWELCKLEGEEGSRRLPGPFLCEAFAVTRCLPDYPQPTCLPLERIAAVVAMGDLSQAKAELADLGALATAGHVVDPLPADYMKIVEALATGRYDGWHFAGHGNFDPDDPNRSAFPLDDLRQLTPEDLPPGDFGKRRPLVFLNACSTGRVDYALAGVGGWAQAFFEAGAGAFLGSFWAIPDDPARRFALAFYRRFLTGTPLAEAVRAARLEIRAPGDPTWLAYTVYANPTARCLAAGEDEEELPPSLRLPSAALPREIRITSPKDGSTILAPGGGASGPVKQPVVGEVYGFDQAEIRRSGLVVEVFISTDRWYPQGIARVRDDGTWRLPTAWFGGSLHTLRAVLKDGHGKEIRSHEISVSLVYD